MIQYPATKHHRNKTIQLKPNHRMTVNKSSVKMMSIFIKIQINKEMPVQQKKSLLISSNHTKALINQFDAEIFTI